MKLSILPVLLCTQLAYSQSQQQHVDNVFIAKKISKTASIIANARLEIVFPLFGAFEEKKWATGWNPVLIYPATEVIEEGTTFRTAGRNTSEREFLWRVSKYDPDTFLIQYLISTPNRYWTITVQCTAESENKTRAEITYTFIGLNKTGNDLNDESLARMYQNNLQDWQDEINTYLKSRE